MRKLTMVSIIIAMSFNYYVHQAAYAAQLTKDEMYDKCGDLLQNAHSALSFNDVNMAKDVLLDPDYKQCLFPEYITQLEHMVNKQLPVISSNAHRRHAAPKVQNHAPQQEQHFTVINADDAVQYRLVNDVQGMKIMCAASMLRSNQNSNYPAELWQQVNSDTFHAGNWYCKIVYQSDSNTSTATLSPYQLP